MNLKGMRYRDLLSNRLKKLILDMTSLKFEFLVFVAYGIWEGKIPAYVGLPVMMTAIGIREYVDFKDKQNAGGAG